MSYHTCKQNFTRKAYSSIVKARCVYRRALFPSFLQVYILKSVEKIIVKAQDPSFVILMNSFIKKLTNILLAFFFIINNVPVHEKIILSI